MDNIVHYIMNKDHVIVEAKSEYTKQLYSLMVDPIYEVLNSIYERCVTNTKNKKEILINFQKELKHIPVWNQSQIDKHVKLIESNCEFLKDLIAAIFISNVKILTSVKIGKDKKKIQVTMPKIDQFVHNVYINSAKSAYENPYIFQKSDNKPYIVQIIQSSIDDTIRTMLPFQNILQSYLGSTLNSDPEESSEDSDESDDEMEQESIDEPPVHESDPDPLSDAPDAPIHESDAPIHESDAPIHESAAPAPAPVLDQVPPEPQVAESASVESGFFDKPEIKSVQIPNAQNAQHQKQMFFPDAVDGVED